MPLLGAQSAKANLGGHFMRSGIREIFSCQYCWFSHHFIPRFSFHDALEQLKTNFRTNFRFKWVFGFVIEYA